MTKAEEGEGCDFTTNTNVRMQNNNQEDTANEANVPRCSAAIFLNDDIDDDVPVRRVPPESKVNLDSEIATVSGKILLSKKDTAASIMK